MDPCFRLIELLLDKIGVHSSEPQPIVTAHLGKDAASMSPERPYKPEVLVVSIDSREVAASYCT